MILINDLGDKIYVDDKDIDFGAIEHEYIDKSNFSNFISELSPKQVEVAICLFMGFKPKEIVAILDLKDIRSFYWINSTLKKAYRIKKERYF